jgi:hypothetical protein
MIDIDNEKLVIKNNPSDKIIIESQHLEEFLIKSKEYGINTWSDKVDALLCSNQIDDVILRFLKEKEKENFIYDLEETGEKSFLNLIKYLYPLIIFIPAGSELSKTQKIIDLLQKNGVKNSEISILFRLSNDTHSSFNKYVKEEHLNSPLSNETKAVLLSQKIPKTIFQSNLRFRLAIVFSKFYAHYQTRDYLKKFPFVLEIMDKTNTAVSENSIDWLTDV